MSTSRHPYRSAGMEAAPSIDIEVDAEALTLRVAQLFVSGWSFSRLAVSFVHGFSFEAFVALVIVASVFAKQPKRYRMMDLVYVALTAALFALTWGLVRLCERV